MTAHGYVSNLTFHGSGRSRYFRLVVHETAEELQAAATKRSPGEDFSGAGGCFQPTPHYQDDDTGLPVSTAFAGIMRLCLEHLNAEVVAHESVHAALHIVRMSMWGDAQVDDLTVFIPPAAPLVIEEGIAYLIGEIVWGVNDVLHAMGAWEDVSR